MSYDEEEIRKLLEIASSNSNDPLKELSEVDRFVIGVGIKEGDTKISSALVYYTYRNWCKDQKPMNRTMFGMAFGKMFKRKRKGNELYYLLNPEPFDQSQETYFEIRKELRDKKLATRIKNEKKEKEEDKTQPGPISGPDPERKS